MVLSLLVASSLCAQTDTPDKTAKIQIQEDNLAQWSEGIADRRIEPGMPTALAIRLLGREPDDTTEIGAACGMLEILTYRHEQMRIITNGGIVSTIDRSESKNNQ